MTPSARSTCYEIRLQGHLEARWLRRFEGLSIDQRPEGETVVVGEMDQAALHGVLTIIRDLGMELILVRQIDPSEESPSNPGSISDTQQSGDLR